MSASGRCLKGNLLRDYLRGTLSARRKATVENHLSLCAECRRLAEAATIAVTFGIQSSDLRARVSEAIRVVAELEKETPLRLHTLIAESEWGSDRFVAGRLLERSREEFAREPKKSLSLARAATWVSERAASAELQFEAWRDCVSICVRLGYLTDAWEAVDRASALASRTADKEYARGLVLYAKAYIGSQPDVWKMDDSLKWADEAARIFMHADAARLRETAEMRAYIHYCLGEYAAAVEICRTLWEVRQEVGLANNFAWYLVEYGQPDNAAQPLAWARQHVNPDDVVTVARLDFTEGRMLRALEHWKDAVGVLERSAATFRRLGMEDTAIRVDLARIRAQVSDAPESLPVAEKAMRDLRSVANTSAALDQREPTRRRRFTAEALDYLREVAEAFALTVDLLRHVEDYVDAITRGPARPFVRPLPSRLM